VAEAPKDINIIVADAFGAAAVLFSIQRSEVYFSDVSL
jgi:hypothetical protein